MDTFGLTSLSQTNQRLREIVHGFVYRTLVCFGSKPFSFLYGENPVPDFYGPKLIADFNSVYNTTRVQVKFQPHHSMIAKSALKYVRLIYLSEDALPYDPWLGDLLPEMTSLKEVYFKFARSSSVTDIEYVMNLLAQHENRPRVHVIFDATMRHLSSLEDFCKPFEQEWAALKTLNVVSLHIVLNTMRERFPMPF